VWPNRPAGAWKGAGRGRATSVGQSRGLRLATYSRKNRLYFAFRELGRAIRTDFLLRYLSSASSGA
jgi:TnpA family transposase